MDSMQSWKVRICEDAYFSNTRFILFMKPGEKHTAALRTPRRTMRTRLFIKILINSDSDLHDPIH